MPLEVLFVSEVFSAVGGRAFEGLRVGFCVAVEFMPLGECAFADGALQGISGSGRYRDILG
ncbi:hypothetical protein BDW74DRAFT_145193 [Aspergillus multicolor]|uniref:uncharacterized protein n=1 Tax=Aspergillus multicolor TaxID=41759 RepID=UPI003CCD52AB